MTYVSTFPRPWFCRLHAKGKDVCKLARALNADLDPTLSTLTGNLRYHCRKCIDRFDNRTCRTLSSSAVLRYFRPIKQGGHVLEE